MNSESEERFSFFTIHLKVVSLPKKLNTNNYAYYLYY